MTEADGLSVISTSEIDSIMGGMTDDENSLSAAHCGLADRTLRPVARKRPIRWRESARFRTGSKAGKHVSDHKKR
jgi:hypothetical protein